MVPKEPTVGSLNSYYLTLYVFYNKFVKIAIIRRFIKEDKFFITDHTFQWIKGRTRR